ncbi:DUF1589 domain-containing protein [Rhodopirellula baltica]
MNCTASATGGFSKCRPGSTWQSRQCFGTKRGVCTIPCDSDMEIQSASHPRQVEPGLQATTRLHQGISNGWWHLTECKNAASISCTASATGGFSKCRPGSTWQPRQCFGTRRGVCNIPCDIDVEIQSASHPHQVEPGLQAATLLHQEIPNGGWHLTDC